MTALRWKASYELESQGEWEFKVFRIGKEFAYNAAWINTRTREGGMRPGFPSPQTARRWCEKMRRATKL